MYLRITHQIQHTPTKRLHRLRSATEKSTRQQKSFYKISKVEQIISAWIKKGRVGFKKSRASVTGAY
jgi:hypothetical protein